MSANCLGGQAALRVDGELEFGAGGCGRRAHGAGGHLGVLLADRADHLGRGETTRGELGGVKPDAHGVVARTKQDDRAHARYAQQVVAHIELAVVAQIERITAVVRAHQVNHHGQVGAALFGGQADLAHDLGQAGQRAVDAVLHRGFSGFGAGADLEGDGECHGAIGGGLRIEIQQVLDATDLLLQRRGHGLADHTRVGARELRAHHDLWRRHLGVLGERQLEDGQRADEEDEDRQHGGKARPVDEKV